MSEDLTRVLMNPHLFSYTAGEGMSEDLRNALNAFLYRTGSASDKFMVKHEERSARVYRFLAAGVVPEARAAGVFSLPT